MRIFTKSLLLVFSLALVVFLGSIGISGPGDELIVPDKSTRIQLNSPIKLPQVHGIKQVPLKQRPESNNLDKLAKPTDVIFFEDFQGEAIPAGWTLIDNDGNTPNENVSWATDAWVAREYETGEWAAASTSWYTPAGQADDWLITPQISTSAQASLSWWALAPDASFPDGYEVRYSTLPIVDMGDFISNDPLYSTAAGPSEWTKRQVDLTAAGLASQDVFFAFRNNSNDQFVLYLDEIQVADSYDYDVGISSEFVSEYTQMPISQVSPLALETTVTNNGLMTATNVTVDAAVYDYWEGATVHTTSSTPIASLASGANQAVSLGSYTPADTGAFVVEYIVSIDEADEDENNDASSEVAYVFNKSYARDDGSISSVYSVGDDGGEMGQIYEMVTAGEIDSIYFWVYNQGGTMTGTTLYAKVYEYVSGSGPGTLLGQTESYTVVPSSARDGLNLTLAMDGGSLALDAGLYFVAIFEGATSDIQLGATADVWTSGAILANFNDGQGWLPLAVGPFALRLRIGYSASAIADESINVLRNYALEQNYPNPFNPSTHIEFVALESGQADLAVYNTAGQKIAELYNGQVTRNQKYSFDFNAEKFAAGVYYYRLTMSDRVEVKKMVLIK